MNKLLCPIFSAGHGGIVRTTQGDVQYTTFPDKMYRHADGSVAYEGVLVRHIKNALIELWSNDNRPWFDASATNLDVGLDNKANAANAIYRDLYRKYNFLYLPIHSNAGGGTGNELFTSPGRTKSDAYATIIGNRLQSDFPEFPLRQDKTDGDLDKESRFYELIATNMPAVYLELGFFDNPTDWNFLRQSKNIEQLAITLYHALCDCEQKVN